MSRRSGVVSLICLAAVACAEASPDEAPDAGDPAPSPADARPPDGAPAGSMGDGCTGPTCDDIYVRASGGDDASAGTAAAPMRTITAAIERARGSGRAVLIAAG